MTTQIPPPMLDANSLAMICDHNRLINGDMRIDQLQSGNGEVGLMRNSAANWTANQSLALTGNFSAEIS